MSGFFSLILVMFKDLVSMIFSLPFMSGFSFGDVLVAIAILAVLSSALIGQLRSFNLSHEASEARFKERSKTWKRRP